MHELGMHMGQPAGVDVGTYVCGDTEPDVLNVNVQASGIAIAIAEAFAEISVNCFAQGNAQVRAEAFAQAETRAQALGEAVSEIFARTEACEDCKAAINALVKVSKELIVEAVAEAWYEVRPAIMHDAYAAVPACMCHAEHTRAHVLLRMRREMSLMDVQHARWKQGKSLTPRTSTGGCGVRTRLVRSHPPFDRGA